MIKIISKLRLRRVGKLAMSHSIIIAPLSNLRRSNHPLHFFLILPRRLRLCNCLPTLLIATMTTSTMPTRAEPIPFFFLPPSIHSCADADGPNCNKHGLEHNPASNFSTKSDVGPRGGKTVRFADAPVEMPQKPLPRAPNGESRMDNGPDVPRCNELLQVRSCGTRSAANGHVDWVEVDVLSTEYGMDLGLTEAQMGSFQRQSELITHSISAAASSKTKFSRKMKLFSRVRRVARSACKWLQMCLPLDDSNMN